MNNHQQNPPTSSELRKVKALVIDHYDQLHAIAARHMGRENSNHSLEVTGLLHEAVCKLLHPEKCRTFKDTNHFLATANIMMKHILIDRRVTSSRWSGGHLQKQELHPDAPGPENDIVEMLIIREELERLARQDPQASQVVMKRCQGYSIDEIAKELSISKTAVYDHWNFGRAWILRLVQSSAE